MLWEGLQTAKAWEQVNDPQIVGELDSEAFYDLCKRAGYSEEACQKAANERANARLDRGLSP